MNFLKSFLTSFVTNLFGGNKPSRADVITAAIGTAAAALADHATAAQAKADAHGAQIDALDAKRAALIAEATQAAQIALNIGALLK